ncbi:MAG: hypothetical protein ACFB10_21360, partial [Salibacteraceae bacterium]
MATYNTPGVTVEEISTLPNSVAQVATAFPGFVGYTHIDPGKPVRSASLVEYEETFGVEEAVYISTKHGIAFLITTSVSGPYTRAVSS